MGLKNKIFDFFSKKSIQVDQSGWLFVDIFAEASSRDLHKLSKTDYLWFYKWRCFVAVSTTANAIAQLERQVVDVKGNQINDPYLKLITFDLLINIVSYLKLNGACYIRKNKVWNKVVSLNILRPDLVTPVLNATWTEIVSYNYNVNWTEKPFPAEEIIAIANFNPMTPYPMNLSWLSDVQAIATAIDADYQASKRNRKYFYNNASVNGVLETEKDIKQDQAEMIVSKWEQKYRGVDNAHKVWVLAGGLKYKPINPSQKEMDFVESRRFNRDEILWFFGVPKAIIGLGEGGEALNVRSFEQIFARRTVQPMAVRIAEALNAWLFDQWTFEFVNVVPSDLLETRNDYIANGITLNEFRATRNYPAIEGGDKLRSAFIISDQEMILQEMEKEVVLPVVKEVETELQTKIKDMISKGMKRCIKWTAEYNQKYRETKISRIDPFEKKYNQKLQIVFNAQEKYIMDEYKKRYKANWKAIKAQFPLLNVAKRAVMYNEVLKDIQKELVVLEATKALLEVDISEPFDLTKKIENDLRKNIEKFAWTIDVATNEKLTASFTTILDQWLSVDNGVKLLQQDFTELQTSRAEKIVRTEVSRAWNIWSELWRKQSGVVSRKERFTAEDERVCPFCWPMDWKTVELETAFFDKNEEIDGTDWTTMRADYSAIEHPPLHCNCRCVILPVID